MRGRCELVGLSEEGEEEEEEVEREDERGKEEKSCFFLSSVEVFCFFFLPLLVRRKSRASPGSRPRPSAARPTPS